MKKGIVKGSILILAVILIMTILVPMSLANVTSTGHSDLSAADVTKISEVLNDLLSSELKIVKTGKSKDYSSVTNDNKLLQLTQKTEEFKEKWYKDIGFKIYDYTSNVKINNVTKLSDKNYMLDVTFQAELILGKDYQIHPKSSDNYVCEVENKSGQWVVDKLIDKVDYYDIVKAKKSNNNTTLANDSDADILANNDTILDTKLKDLEERSTNIDKLVKRYKEITKKQTKNTLLNCSKKATLSPLSYTGINRQAVVNYADTYAINHNPNYTYISGADCTNFASQAVNAGGFPRSGSWYPYSSDWVNVEDFYDYMTNSGYASGSSLDSDDKTGQGQNIDYGDVIQWRHLLYLNFSHSTIAAHDSDTYGWLLDAHSNDRQDYPMSMYFSDFSYDRDIHFY